MKKDETQADPQAKSQETAKNAPPSYAAVFRCIGPECEDTCCRDWSIPLDKKTYQIYKQFPEGRLGSVVAESVSLNPDAPEALYARIDLASSGFCPFFTPDQLCAIQREYGAAALSSTCSIYPRTLNLVEGVLEGSLALSCPEAARNILLSPDATRVAGNLLSGNFRADNFARLPGNTPGFDYKPYTAFHPIRDLLISMITDRSRPLWQRLLLIGSLCKRLDDIRSEEQGELVPAILNDYRQIRDDPAVTRQLEAMPSDTRKKLDVVLTLTNERLREKKSGRRFADTFWNFIEGIGSAMEAGAIADASQEEDVRLFREAENKYYKPFFEKRPYVLENYLVNYMLQNLFPFGREGSPHFIRRGIFDEYILMATQFAWMNALLIGISGRHKTGFAEEHVIKAVQSFCRAVEHFPYVLVSINDYIKSQKLDSLHGMAILIR